jgi:hypothetical protein
VSDAADFLVTGLAPVYLIHGPAEFVVMLLAAVAVLSGVAGIVRTYRRGRPGIWRHVPCWAGVLALTYAVAAYLPAISEFRDDATRCYRGSTYVTSLDLYALLARHAALIAAGTLVAALGIGYGWILEDLGPFRRTSTTEE